MNPWLQAFMAIGGGSIFVAALNALTNRKNLGSQVQRTDAETSRTDAETDEIIRKTYGGLLADVQGQLDAALRRIVTLESYAAEQNGLLEVHSAYDFVMIQKLRECDPGINLPAPPPLTPLRRPPVI